MQIIIWLVRLFEERNALLKYLCYIEAHSILNLKNILQEKNPALPPPKKTPKTSEKPQQTQNLRVIKFNAGIYKVKLKQLKNL